MRSQISKCVWSRKMCRKWTVDSNKHTSDKKKVQNKTNWTTNDMEIKLRMVKSSSNNNQLLWQHSMASSIVIDCFRTIYFFIFLLSHTKKNFFPFHFIQSQLVECVFFCLFGHFQHLWKSRIFWGNLSRDFVWSVLVYYVDLLNLIVCWFQQATVKNEKKNPKQLKKKDTKSKCDILWWNKTVMRMRKNWDIQIKVYTLNWIERVREFILFSSFFSNRKKGSISMPHWYCLSLGHNSWVDFIIIICAT